MELNDTFLSTKLSIDNFLSLKLSSDGGLGKDFEEKLKNISQTNKQSKDLLPELNRWSTASTSGFKRKSHTYQDTKVMVQNGKKYFSNERIPETRYKPSKKQRLC